MFEGKDEQFGSERERSEGDLVRGSGKKFVLNLMPPQQSSGWGEQLRVILSLQCGLKAPAPSTARPGIGILVDHLMASAMGKRQSA
jgi:hypothetical protein